MKKKLFVKGINQVPMYPIDNASERSVVTIAPPSVLFNKDYVHDNLDLNKYSSLIFRSMKLSGEERRLGAREVITIWSKSLFSYLRYVQQRELQYKPISNRQSDFQLNISGKDGEKLKDTSNIIRGVDESLFDSFLRSFDLGQRPYKSYLTAQLSSMHRSLTILREFMTSVVSKDLKDEMIAILESWSETGTVAFNTNETNTIVVRYNGLLETLTEKFIQYLSDESLNEDSKGPLSYADGLKLFVDVSRSMSDSIDEQCVYIDSVAEIGLSQYNDLIRNQNSEELSLVCNNLAYGSGFQTLSDLVGLRTSTSIPGGQMYVKNRRAFEGDGIYSAAIAWFFLSQMYKYEDLLTKYQISVGHIYNKDKAKKVSLDEIKANSSPKSTHYMVTYHLRNKDKGTDTNEAFVIGGTSGASEQWAKVMPRLLFNKATVFITGKYDAPLQRDKSTSPPSKPHVTSIDNHFYAAVSGFPSVYILSKKMQPILWYDPFQSLTVHCIELLDSFYRNNTGKSLLEEAFQSESNGIKRVILSLYTKFQHASDICLSAPQLIDTYSYSSYESARVALRSMLASLQSVSTAEQAQTIVNSYLTGPEWSSSIAAILYAQRELIRNSDPADATADELLSTRFQLKNFYNKHFSQVSGVTATDMSSGADPLVSTGISQAIMFTKPDLSFQMSSASANYSNFLGGVGETLRLINVDDSVLMNVKLRDNDFNAVYKQFLRVAYWKRFLSGPGNYTRPVYAQSTMLLSSYALPGVVKDQIRDTLNTFDSLLAVEYEINREAFLAANTSLRLKKVDSTVLKLLGISSLTNSGSSLYKDIITDELRDKVNEIITETIPLIQGPHQISYLSDYFDKAREISKRYNSVIVHNKTNAGYWGYKQSDLIDVVTSMSESDIVAYRYQLSDRKRLLDRMKLRKVEGAVDLNSLASMFLQDNQEIALSCNALSYVSQETETSILEHTKRYIDYIYKLFEKRIGQFTPFKYISSLYIAKPFQHYYVGSPELKVSINPVSKLITGGPTLNEWEDQIEADEALKNINAKLAEVSSAFDTFNSRLSLHRVGELHLPQTDNVIHYESLFQLQLSPYNKAFKQLYENAYLIEALNEDDLEKKVMRNVGIDRNAAVTGLQLKWLIDSVNVCQLLYGSDSVLYIKQNVVPEINETYTIGDYIGVNMQKAIDNKFYKTITIYEVRTPLSDLLNGIYEQLPINRAKVTEVDSNRIQTYILSLGDTELITALESESEINYNIDGFGDYDLRAREVDSKILEQLTEILIECAK